MNWLVVSPTLDAVTLKDLQLKRLTTPARDLELCGDIKSRMYSNVVENSGYTKLLTLMLMLMI